MKTTNLIFIILLLVFAAGCNPDPDKLAIKAMVNKFPEIYQDIDHMERFKKYKTIYDYQDSITYTLFCSAHLEQQFAVLSKSGKASYAIPFPENQIEYWNYQGIANNKNGKTFARELEMARKTINPQNAQGMFYNIFVGLLQSSLLKRSDTANVKANITKFKNDSTKRMLLSNYNNVFRRFIDTVDYESATYLCAWRGEIYEILHSSTNKSSPYSINVYWNRVLE